MRYLYILIVVIVSCNSLSAQEITNLLMLSDDEVGLAEANDIYRDGDRNYFILAGNSLLDMDLGVDMSDVGNLPLISYDSGDTITFHKSFLFEYDVGGTVDYTSMSRFYHEYYAVDGDLMAYAFNSPIAWFDNQEVFGGDIYLNEDEPFRNDLAVYDKFNDTLLWHYPDHDNYIHNLRSQAVDIDGDYLYYAMTFLYPHPFMGDSLRRTDTVYQGINYSSVFHKINWRTNEKLWSINMASEVLPDEIRQVKVLDDGSVMMAIESYGPFTWDREVLDPDHMYGSPFGGYYNIVLAHISADGEYLNHVHLWAPGNDSAYDVQIEPDGNIYAYGVIFTGDAYAGEGFVEVHGDTIRFDSGMYGTGNLMVFNKDLDLRWAKEYGGADRVHVTSVNELLNGEVIVNIRIFKDVIIDGVLYENEYFDNEHFGEPDPLKQNYILHYNANGELISKPLPFGDSFDTREILELAENKYLFLLRNYQREYSTPTFFNQEIALYDVRSITIMEVEGNFLESITAVNDFTKATEIVSYPNPVLDSPNITLTLPEECIGQDCNLIIYDVNGRQLNDLHYTVTQEKILLSTNNLNQGINSVLIKSNGKFYTSRIVKIN